MVQAPSKPISLTEFLSLPEIKPAREYFNDYCSQKPMPQGEHSTIQGELVSVINASLKPIKIARAYPELRCSFADSSIVPDVSVFRWERIPRKADGTVANTFAIAPDWVIEILSPEQRQTRVTAKILNCLNHGCELGWLIDPSERSVLVYFSKLPTMLLSQKTEQLPMPSFAENLVLTVGEIFDWLLV